MAWEVSFECRAYVAPVMQKDLQILIAFYVQLWSHFLWLILHHFFELCLLSNQWLTSYADHWTEEDGGLKQCPWIHSRYKGALVFPDSLWLRDVSPVTEKQFLTNPLKPCNRTDCTVESFGALHGLEVAPRSQLWGGTQGYHTLGFQQHWELQSQWKN